MRKSFEYRGLWWLPEHPEKDSQGTVTFHPEKGTRLELQGDLRDDPIHGDLISPPAIYGVSDTGKKIAILDCLQLSSEPKIVMIEKGSKTLPYSSFFGHFLVVGGHFPNIQSIRMSSLTCGFSDLLSWTNAGGIRIDHSHSPDAISCTHENREIASVHLGDRVKLSLRLLHSASISRSEFSLDEDVYIWLNADPGLDFNSLNDIMMKMRDFLTMCTLEVCVPTQLYGTICHDGDPAPADLMPVEIYYKLIDCPVNRRTPHWSEMLVPFADIRDRFENVIKSWFDGYEKMSSFFDMYFSTHYVPVMYIHHRFLSYVNAIELYHRIKYSNHARDPRLHKERLKSIMDSIPDEHKEWMAVKLQWSNEPSLRERLEEVVARTGRLVDGLLDYSENGIGRIVTTRNYLTHRDPELEPKAAKNLELIYLTRVLDIMVRMLLLKEIGYDLDDIEKRITRTWLYRGLVESKKELTI